MMGSVDDPVKVLAAADALVLPSRTEGVPAVAIEAGLVGIPTAGSDVGGIGSVVVDDVTGRLVPPSDVGALAAALDDVLEHRDRLGAAAQRCLRHFDLERVADEWASLIAGIAG